MTKSIIKFFTRLTLFLSPLALEAPKPIQLSLWDPIHILDKDESITGLRFSLIYAYF